MKELTDEQLKKVTGGTSDNPKGLKPGDSVYFYHDFYCQWLWGNFLYYDLSDGKYRVKWNEQKIIFGSGDFFPVPAGEESFPKECIK